ncbi:hypothetical protein [Luteolibacter sp. LG18]|uniref:hypothetical protein n=1 Tax=Luteolibacter sp. LG18 TaxID=2819286 RepID=UPI002B2E7A1C|nr:hypothetical protein llg_43310 [Luteolibacter sp. LG18]
MSALDQLRNELRRKFPGAHAEAWRLQEEGERFARFTDLEAFRPGTISEVVPARGLSGFGLLIAALLGEPDRAAEFPELALVDGGDGFDPESFSAAACSKVLWVRCGSALEMLKAGELMVRDGTLSTVLLDAAGLDLRQLRALPASAWWRLKQGAEQSGSRLIVLSPAQVVPCASLRLALTADLTLADFSEPRPVLLNRLQARPERLRHAT